MVGRLVVPPGLWRFPLKAPYNFVNTSLAGDTERAEDNVDPCACPPDAHPMTQAKTQQEARSYAVENIPRFDDEPMDADDNEDEPPVSSYEE